MIFMNGDEASKIINKIDPSIFILLCTADDME